ncbi:MAG: DUF2461 domain-containing protein [Candidatus Absconditicoccaceae bacterium]
MKEILKFLEDLEVNNNREWFDIHREEYQKIRKKVLELADRLIKEISKFYDLGDEIRPNDCIFRINRDTRFSKDKTPYKINFGIEITPNGKRGGLPCFYLHIQPGNNSFIAGGLYMPDSQTTGAIREGIDKKGKDLKKLIDKILKLESFYLYEDAVKTAPRGYKKDNPNIKLLKLKHRIVERPVSDKELLGKEFEKVLVKDFKKMAPFVGWLQLALST